MTSKASKNRGSVSFSRALKSIARLKEEWRVRLRDQHIFNSNYSFDILLLVESSYTLCPATSEIEAQGEESTAVKFLTPSSLIKFLNNTCTLQPEYEYYTLYDDAFHQLQEEYAQNNKLSPESFVFLIKLRILAFNEVIAHERELVKQLKFSLEQEMRNISEPQVNPKEKDGGKGAAAAKRADRKSRTLSMNQNILDAKYLQAKAGKLPNFVETSKVPTIYNTDYDEPNPENIYYVLSGIYDSSLIASLKQCNITILSLIELGLEGVKFNAEDIVDNLNELQFDRLLSLRSFWRSLSQNNTHIPKVSKNCCYIRYAIPDPATQTPSFNNFLILLKNISDFKRLYYHYFTRVRYLDVTELSKPVCLSSMYSYNCFLDLIPNECISIPLMLHALLDEVCVRVDNWTNKPLEDILNKRKVKRKHHGGPVAQIKSLLKEYECPFKKVQPIVKMPKAVNISYGNTLEFINAHVPINKYIDTVEITLNQLKNTLPLQLFQKIDARNTFNIMFYNYVFSKWSEQLVNVSTEELTLCVYAYLFTRGNFRKINIPEIPTESMKEKKIQECMFGVTKLYNEYHKVLNVKLNTSFYKTNSSLQSDIMSTTVKIVPQEEVYSNSCDNLSQQYKTLAQDLDTATFIQMINNAYNNYNHFDYKYFAPTDTILIRFHYTNDKGGFSKKDQQYFLRTPLCFRDFCFQLLLQDSEWFLKEEKKHWEQVYINREKEKEYLLQHPKVDEFFDPLDFIIPGSFKHEYNKLRSSSSRKSASKTIKGEKKPEDTVNKKVQRKSKDSSIAMKFDNTFKVRDSVSVTVPSCELYDSTKEYAFEIYNLGQNFYCLQCEETLYHSIISVKLTKQELPKQPVSCTFLVSSQDTHLMLHCEQDVIYKQIRPFHFNVSLTNGIVMVFSVPNPPVLYVESRHILVNKMNDDMKSSKLGSFKSFSNKPLISTSTDEIDPKVIEIKNQVLQYLTIAMKEQLPVFKIISSRLHKYQYVKRVKSRMCLPVGSIYKRVCCKPVIYKRLPKNQSVYEGKCIPYSDLINKERSPISWKWNCSIPTGLSMETVQANVPHAFYIRQRYVIERTDLPSIQDEAYRCYLRCGIIMKFLKDGSIKTLSPDKTLSHYKYGYFSSNKHRVSKTNLLKEVRLKRQTNIIPLHAYKKNLSALEKKIRKLSEKYKKHLIDIADNYRFESSRADSRKMHKIYKLSKRIYTKDSHVIPLINHSVITSEGRYIDVRKNVVHDTFKKFEETRYRDYLLNETVTRREDGTAWMIDANGISITQFPDGSRIKTWYTILDENLIVGSDPKEYKKNATINSHLVEEVESLTKYCQTVEEYETNEEEDVDVLYNKEHNNNKETTNNDCGFVFVGMNYSFEHPNFATVSYYCWEDSSADILMTDNIRVTAFAEGTYKVNLINNDVINVNTEDLEFIVQNDDQKLESESCFINLGVFNMDKPKPDHMFLAVQENDNKVFIITCDGQTINKKNFTPNASSLDSQNSISNDQMFVMKRDLSGIEMIREPIPYKFVHTMIDLKNVLSKKNHENVVMGPTKMKIYQPLKKTYSEHLMMMYDVPILATTKERKCLDKLWKLHDLDINTILAKRSPLIIFERYISYLPTEIIVEQVAQAVLKCIIEGSENLPNIELIQNLERAEEPVAKSELMEEKVSARKNTSKHLTNKKQIEKYKQIIKHDSIPRYFETVKGLMFLAVEECAEDAMEESCARRGLLLEKRQSQTKKSPTKKKLALEVENKFTPLDKAEKQNKIKKPEVSGLEKQSHKSVRNFESSPSVIQTKFNIPERLSIHLKPSAPVHEIILTANGLQIITDKNIEKYEYGKHGHNQHSTSSRHLTAPNTGKRFTFEKALEQIAAAPQSSADINQKYVSSYFGEDIGSYFGSVVKIPSWDDSLCQKACINSISTTTNTLVTIPENKVNEIATCNQATCACSVDSIERLAKCCKCKKYYCNCKDTYSAFATCALQNELNISEAVCVLATKIIHTIEKDAEKFELLHSKLESIIKDTAAAWAMSEPVTNDLIKTLRWIIENKIRTQNTIPEETAINIVKEIESTISKIKISNRTVTLSIGNLQKMADLVMKMVCNSKNKTDIVKEIRKLLGDAQISRLDIIDTLKLTKEKIRLYYVHGLYSDLPLPEIPAESKCCKIAQYVDYLLDSSLERTCVKCNSISIIHNTSIHNTSPVNHRSRESFGKSGSLTKSQLDGMHTENNSNITNSFTYKDEEIKGHAHNNETTNIIIEPFNYNEKTPGDKVADDLNVGSGGGFSLVKSCDEIVDVSVPFINKKITSSNTNNNNKKKSSVHIAGNIKLFHPRPEEQLSLEDQKKYFLSKLQFPIFSESPVKSTETDLITILAPDHNEPGVITEYRSKTYLSPILLQSTLQEAPKTTNTKPIVYDGDIISK